MIEPHRAFEPQRLTGEASLQRVVIAALPGIGPDVAGRPASEICSRDALAKLVADTPGLPAPRLDRLGDQLAHLRSSPDPTVRSLAVQALRTYGVRLGALLATLKHPGNPSQQGGTAARRAYLEYWLGIERVWLGGGLLVPDSVEDVLRGMKQLLARTGTALDLRVACSPRVLSLIGAARLVGRQDGRALALDAGHSSIKAAVAVVEDATLVALELLPARPAPVHGGPQEVEDGIVTALVSFADALPGRPDRHRRVVVSVASYLRDDAPVDDGRSIYGGLAPERVGRLVAASSGDDLHVEFVHDGTASAFGIADPTTSAVVTVGTWLGIGFTPANRPLLGGVPVVREHHDVSLNGDDLVDGE